MFFLPNGGFKEVRAFQSHVTRLCFTSSGDTLVTSSEDGSCVVYNIEHDHGNKFFDYSESNNELFLSDRQSERIRVGSVLRDELNNSIESKQFELKKQNLRFEILRRHISMTFSHRMVEFKRMIETLETEYEQINRDFTKK